MEVFIIKIFIAWNSFSILEFISSVDDYKDYYCMIDSYYNKNGKERISKLLGKFISLGYFKGIILEEQILHKDLDTIAMMSYINDYNYNILNNLTYKNLILVEEGLHDYVTKEIDSKYLKIIKSSKLFINNKKDVLNKELFGEVHEIGYKDSILDNFMEILDFDKQSLQNVDLILLTSPMDKDYSFKDYLPKVIKYLEENYENKTILIKRHPRDYSLYNSNKFKSIYVDAYIPGQLINLYYNCEKLYTHPSTVILSEKDTSKSKILKFMEVNNLGYIESFNYKKMKECKIIEIK